MPSDDLVYCPICCSPTDANQFVLCHGPTNDFNATSTLSAEHKRSDHRACFACIHRYAKTTLDDHMRLHDQHGILRCMHPKCGNPLPLAALRRALPRNMMRHLKKRGMRDQKLLQTLDPGRVAHRDTHLTVAEKLSNIVIRRCPRCSTSLTKSIGCAVVYCPCGTTICFTCGERRSQCKTEPWRLAPHSCVRRSDKARIQELYEASTAEEQRFIRALYPDVEQFKSIKHWLLDKAHEKAVWVCEPHHLLEAALVFMLMLVMLAIIEAAVRQQSEIVLSHCAVWAMFLVLCYIAL